MGNGVWDDIVYMYNNPKKSFKNFVGNTVTPVALGALSMGAQGINALEKAVGAQSSMIPLEYRTYLANVGNPFSQSRELTEADLMPEDLQLFKKLISEKETNKKDKSSNARQTKEGVMYGYDYKTGYDKSAVPGKERAKKTLGKFDYKDKPGEFEIRDVYDFDIPDAVEKGQADYGELIFDRLLSGDFEKAASAYGAKVIPKGSSSARKVKVNVKK